ncbi:hypothetical protein JOF56_009267 [Kibdelosporangium banguiense]|uniref:Uncharacterized protein n=1 Tax=Kibdelosporangium banguiense TaxID=1365924 RepID=A0ABS4TWW4_9PSEU|nr:hypothetical protein [Kibdelosporangium banguiense]MBP2328882.1 hypothetical protein [Kibdelosporangium banguiense]
MPSTWQLERNRYFTGKAMAARDFAADPDYLLGVHRAHNRLCHGWGVLDGLTVTVDQTTTRCVRVAPGVALDRNGREVIVSTGLSATVDLYALPALLCVQYAEDEIEPVPPVSVASADATASEYNRVRENPKTTWITDTARWQQIVTDDRADLTCDELDLIPLAVVRSNGQSFVVQPVRRPLFSPSRLTRISSVNWQHDRTSPLRDLTVTFDRRLHATAHGVSANTFLVYSAEHPFADRTRLLCPQGMEPVLDENRTVVTYPVSPVPVGHWVYVSLLCDFLTDENGSQIDGSHLGGRLPTGNGVPGGVFDSWFQVDVEVTP